jgi:hypothetical protein
MKLKRHTLGWLTEKFGLPPETIATFTSGGTEANLSAIVVGFTQAFPGLRRIRTASPFDADPYDLPHAKKLITATTRLRI